MPELFPFQKEAVKRSIHFLTTNLTSSCYNGSDPGTGKTIITIETCKALDLKKILVICPSIMVPTWENEFNVWWPNITTQMVLSGSKDLHKIYDKNVIIISYDLVKKDLITNVLAAEGYECLILDEAHKVKSTNSARTKKILKKIWPTVKYKIALSGTPFLTCVTDCYTLFSRMMPNNFFGSYYDFGRKFSNCIETPWGPRFSGIINDEILRTLIRKHFFFKYKKAVLKELPPIMVNKIILPKQYSFKEYEDFFKGKDLENINNLIYEAKDIEHISGIRRAQGLLKILPIAQYTVELLEQNIPCVVFTYHKEVLKQYQECFKEYKPLYIDGSLNATAKQKNIESFQNGESNLIIIQIQSGGVGVTLTRGKAVIMAELPWVPADLDQAIARVWRHGQENKVDVFYFVVKNSIDEQISSVLVRRSLEFNKVFS